LDHTQSSILEIAHVLFVDIVSYSKLPSEAQRKATLALQRAIGASPTYLRFENNENLIVLPTGDGAALVFFRDVEAPARCALELATTLKQLNLPVRMGIHTGPVYRIADINANRNVSGGGINVAQRVMDVGDAGHILVSKAVAEVLLELSTWNGRLRDLGETAVKHGLVLHLFNLCTDQAGNAAVPSRFASPALKTPFPSHTQEPRQTQAPAHSRSGMHPWSGNSGSGSGQTQALLAPGSQFLHYRILEQIGDGGMGVVFSAEDLRLGRRVALKFMPTHQADSAQALERFQREARAASALNHPNICTVYDVGSSEGREYIAMELLEGRTLKQIVAAGRTPISQCVNWAVQIADALETAHMKGIVHRDIKPGNILVTQRGQVKVLDFGLAKLSKQNNDEDGFARTDVTLPGVPLGTVAYMSPEQARGTAVDTRTDIFSFGMVLYELVTGSTPFPGTTSAVIFDGILNREPAPIAKFNSSVPAPVEALIQHAMEKNAADRYQSITEMRADLEAIAGLMSSSGGLGELSKLSRTRAHSPIFEKQRKAGSSGRYWLGAIAAAGILAAAVGGWLWKHPPAAPGAANSLQSLPRQLTFAGADTAIQSSGISPDGKYVAYGDPSGLYLRLIATGETRKLADATYVSAMCWTPDASRLIVAEGGAEITSTSLVVVSATTGAVRKLVDHAFVDQGCAPGDGSRVTIVRTDLAQVWTIGIDGEEPAKVMDAPTGRELLMISMSPDGKWMAAMIDGGGKPTMIEICSADGRGCNKVVEADALIGPGGIANMAWDHHGRLLYARAEPSPNQYNSRIWRMTLDAGGHPVGDAADILSLTGQFPGDLTFTNDDRRLSYTGSHLVAKLRRADLEGNKLSKERPLSGEEAYESPFAWTPDGQSILSFSTLADGLQLLRRDLATGSSQPLAMGSVRRSGDVTGDGVWALYTSSEKKTDQRPTRIMRVPVKGGLAEVVIDHIAPFSVDCAAVPRCILSETVGDEMVISALDPIKGRGEEFLRDKAGVFGNVTISPDGQHIVYGHASRDQYLTVFDIATRKSSQIHIQGFGSMDDLEYAHDGKSLFMCFWAPGFALARVSLDGHAQKLRESPLGMTGFAVSPDDRQIVFGETQGEANVWLVDRQP
jgi:eukaryotic-like serine/threonine-protein kinase